MTKAKREMEAHLKLVDAAVEVRDARCPLATQNPDLERLLSKKPRVIVLNKRDLANADITQAWIDAFKREGTQAVSFSATQKAGKAQLLKALDTALTPQRERWKQRGVDKTMRVLICGIPNVGKSSIINALCVGGRAKTGAKPGLTRGMQWLRIGPRLELMDSPGLLWPRLDDQALALHLCYINAIRDEILEEQQIATRLATELMQLAPKAMEERYGIIHEGPGDFLTAIAKRRGFLLKGGALDEDKAARAILEDFRDGKLGRVTLETPGGKP